MREISINDSLRQEFKLWTDEFKKTLMLISEGKFFGLGETIFKSERTLATLCQQ